MSPRVLVLMVAIAATLGGAACGGGTGSPPPPPASYTVGGTVSGLTGSGLVLQDNHSSNLTVNANGGFTFPGTIASGATYDVSVLTQPSNPAQSCSVTNGSGRANANVNNVQVSCSTATFTIGGTVSGLAGTGLVLQDNLKDNLTIITNGNFTFAMPVNAGTAYSVTVLNQPSNPAQNCSVTGGSGNANANVTDVVVTCTTNAYTIGGIVSGLVGSGLVLQDNLTDNLAITGSGSFTFATPVNSGGSYSVTVLTQPSGPLQHCAVNNGSGNATTNVANIQVVCTSEWTWIGGSKLTGQNGDYGHLSQASPSNIPGARYGASTWIDKSGNLWLFGGIGNDAVGIESYLNDLWEFSNGEWTWVSGSDAADATGVYDSGLGTLTPGSRAFAANWMDDSGSLWLFGGYGVDPTGTFAAPLNDVWKFSNGGWTWMGGSDLTSQPGSYGTQGVSDPNNIPGARNWASGFPDASGNFWLFGGNGFDSAGNTGNLNDLWEFSGGQWTWVSGSNTVNQNGTYGTLGQTGTGNVPGARLGASMWIDAAGNPWLFGGNGLDSAGTSGYLDDVWEFTSGNWIWQGGADTLNTPASYGVQGIATASNNPGARVWSTTWVTSSGDVWLLGGQQLGGRELDDLWKFSAGQWTWITGSNLVFQTGVYGTKGTPAPNNAPGARQLGASWIDTQGNLWLMGGYGLGSTSGLDDLNDLWEFQP